MTPPIVVAPHFHLPGRLHDRLRVRESGGWRMPSEPESADWTPPSESVRDLGGFVCLFALPAHLLEGLWSVVGRPDEFDAVADEVAALLAFKELPLPAGAACELIAARPGAPAGLAPGGLWGVVNLGDGETAVEFDGLAVWLQPGEGCKVPGGLAFDVVPPARESPELLLVIREAAAPASAPVPRASSPDRRSGG